MKVISKVKTAFVLTFCMTILSGMAQKIDQDRMNRDLAVAEDILISLLKNDSENVMFFSTGASSTFLPDYGVMFSLSGSGHFVGEDFGRTFSFSFDEDDWNGRNYRYHFRGDDDHDEAHEREIEHEQERERERERERAQERRNDRGYKGSIVIEGDDISQESTETVKNAMKLFLADYADLIGQLKPEHKIMISSAGNRWDFGGISIGTSGGRKIAAEITKKDIIDYKSGKISRTQLMDRIVMTETEKNPKKETDLELLSSIFRRLYKPDLSDTYYIADPLSYERLTNFGVIYKLRMYSSTSDGRGRHRITTLGLSGLSDEERDKKVEELYPKFEADLKQNILEYGKTLKSLQEDEILMFKVKLTQCKGCDMPKNLDVSIKQSVLVAYNAGKLSKSAALAKMNIKQFME